MNFVESVEVVYETLIKNWINHANKLYIPKNEISGWIWYNSNFRIQIKDIEKVMKKL